MRTAEGRGGNVENEGRAAGGPRRPAHGEGREAGHAYLLSIPGLQQMLVIQHVLLNSRDLKGKDWR